MKKTTTALATTTLAAGLMLGTAGSASADMGGVGAGSQQQCEAMLKAAIQRTTAQGAVVTSSMGCARTTPYGSQWAGSYWYYWPRSKG